MRKATMAAMLLAGLAVWQTPRAEAEVKLHGMFTDHMVLQRDMQVPIWGTADPGETVEVRIAGPNMGQGAGMAANAQGQWQATFKSLPSRRTLQADRERQKQHH